MENCELASNLSQTCATFLYSLLLGNHAKKEFLVISDIRFSGFQGFASDREHTAKLAPLTLIFGSNASGKSSILRAAKLINQSIDPSPEYSSGARKMFRFEGEIVSLASFANCAHMHLVNEPMTLGMTYNLEATGSLSFLAGLFSEVSLTWTLREPGWVEDVTVGFKSKSQDLSDLEIFFEAVAEDGALQAEITKGDFGQLTRFINHPQLEKYKPTIPKLYRADTLEFQEQQWDFESAFEQLEDAEWWLDLVEGSNEFSLRGVIPYLLPATSSGIGSPEEGDFRSGFDSMAKQYALRLVGLLLQIVQNAARKTSAGLISVAPLRSISERLTFQQAPVHSAEDHRSGSPNSTEQQVSNWLEELTDGRFSYQKVTFVPEEMSIFGALETPQVIDNQTGTSVSFMDVGVGLSQVLPILEAMAIEKPLKTIFVEQPELHLHPKMQASLADLFVNLVNKEKGQVVIETHSEAFLLRVQKRLREGTLSAKDVQVLFVESGDRKPLPMLDHELDYLGKGKPTNSIRNLPLRMEDDFEIEFPISFAGLRLSEYL